MRRRSFVKASLLTSAAAATAPGAALATTFSKKDSEYYELRVYSLKDDVQQTLVLNYLKDAYIPALNRLGIQHVGVFTELKPTGQTRVFTLTPYKDLDQFDAVNTKLTGDEAYQQAGAAYLNAPATSPAYERIESSLLKAFPHSPKMAVPEAKARIFELRQYQSASESAGKKKIGMFDEMGEANIFRRLGFRPVFFAETVVGSLRPNLTYMVTFDDMEAHNTHWKAFGGDPEWQKLRATPGYADAQLVSKITSTFIVPTDFSQI